MSLSPDPTGASASSSTGASRPSGSPELAATRMVSQARWKQLAPSRRVLWAALALLTASVLAWALFTPSPARSPSDATPPAERAPAPAIGHPAPEATLLDLANNPVALSSLRGKVVVLNFWYVACEPCRFEMPLFERLHQADQARGLAVIGVNVADDAQTISSFTSQLGIDYPILRDLGQRTALAYQVRATPTTFILDRQGIVRDIKVGPFLDSADLDRAINPLLAAHN